MLIHGGMGREARLKAQEAFRHDPAGTGVAGDRRRRRGHQPATRAPDGELRPALESQPPGAALRADSPHRSDRGVPPVEPCCRRNPRGRRLSQAARQAGTGAANPWAGRCSTSSASSSSRGVRCGNSWWRPYATANNRRFAPASRTAMDHARSSAASSRPCWRRAPWLKTPWTPGASAPYPRRHGARRSPSAAASLRRVLLPAGVSRAWAAPSKQREPRRYEITHVPATGAKPGPAHRHRRPRAPPLRAHCVRQIAWLRPRDNRWRRFVCPGHPLLDAVIDLTLERHRELLETGRRVGGRP